MLRNRLDNDIINSWYAGWQSVRLDEEHIIKIPDGWSLQTGDLLSLYDDTGKQIAFGKRYDGGIDFREEWPFLSERFNDQVVDYELLNSEFIDDTYNGWAETKYTCNSGQQITLLSVDFRFYGFDVDDYAYALYFEEPTKELHEIATAMIYSAGGGWTFYSKNGRFSFFGLD